MTERRREQMPNTKTTHELTGNHAIVIGGGVAGLLAARVLSDHFADVTIVERDDLTQSRDFRRGVPQARHPHTLLLRGQAILEQQFPGLVDDLCAQGAIQIDARRDVAFYTGGQWHLARRHATSVSLTSSRPLLEGTLYDRLTARPNVRVMANYEAVGLAVEDGHVAGVRLRSRHSPSAIGTPFTLSGDLVVDTSGRASRAPRWLAEWGYTPPRETTIDAFAGFSSRIYRRPAHVAGTWQVMFVRPTPPFSSRGGIIIPLEGDRWHVALIGMAGDYPPTDEAEYLEFARSLPTPAFYEAIEDAEPLTRPRGSRRTENRMRHYHELPRHLDGFLVSGDAVYALNPVYSQGMTAAAMGGLALQRTLNVHRRSRAAGDLTGLAQRFQQYLHEAVVETWTMDTQADEQWPTTEAHTDGAHTDGAHTDGMEQVVESVYAGSGAVGLGTTRMHTRMG